MKFASFYRGGALNVGIVDAATGRVRPVSGVADMIDLVTRHAQSKISSSAPELALSEIKLTAPIPVPRRNIFCVGKNYGEHAREFSNSGFEAGAKKDQAIDEYPAIFSKGPNTVIGPDDDVGLDPHISAKWDYEAELALVIGRRCRSVSKAEALDCVFGYFLANDVSQRDLQRRHGGQWLKGKSIDRTMPIGPWIVTPDELDLPEIQLELTLNGKVMQSALIKQMAFPVAELIAELSFGMTLEPGDVLITGTPAGVGNAREPQVFLKPGDEMVVSATGLGALRNRVVAANLHGTTDIPSMGAGT